MNVTGKKFFAFSAMSLAAAYGCGQIQATEYMTGLNGAVGIDHQVNGNNLIISTNYSGGQPYNFEKISLGTGQRTQFSSMAGLSSEVYHTVTRQAWGSHAMGSVFTPGGAGGGGSVYKIEPDGSSFSLFTTLPTNPSSYTTARWDYTGMWNNDLIVSDESAGKVWRVDSTGAYTEIFNVPGSRPEGLLVLGNNARYGPWAGKVMALTNGGSTFYAIDQNGSYQAYDIGIGDLEALQVFNYNPNGAAAYVVTYPGKIWKLTGFESVNGFEEGDMIVASEFGGLRHVYWNGSQFQHQLLTNDIGQIEGLVSVPEPGTLGAIGLGAAFLLRRRSKR